MFGGGGGFFCRADEYVYKNSEARAVVRAFQQAPAYTRKANIDTLIGALKTAGVWSKFTLFYILASHTEQAAYVNWNRPGQFTLVKFGSVTHTADRGVVGDGSTGYLNSGLLGNAVPNTYLFTQNSAHMGVWVGTDVTSATQLDCGTNNARINSRSGTTTPCAANSTATNVALGIASSIGWTCWSRDNSANFDTVRDLAAPVNTVLASGTLSTLALLICAQNSGGVGTNFSTRRIQAFHQGAALSDTERDAVQAALATYMTAVGA